MAVPTPKNPFHTAIANVDNAAQESRRRDNSNILPEDFQRKRYEVLSTDPKLLTEFVSEALGTQEPEAISAGMEDYLKEMGRRYGK